MKPTRYRLAANHGCEAPRNVVVFDCETTTKRITKDGRVTSQIFRIAVAKSYRIDKGRRTREKVLRTDSHSELWQWISSHQKPRELLWVFAHNLHFDLTVSHFFELLDNNTYTLGPVYPRPGDSRVRGRKPWKGMACFSRSPYFLKVMGKTGRVNLVDSFNYIPASLASIGESLGLPKMDIDFGSCTEQELYQYCENDVEILARLVHHLIEAWRRIDGGVWQVTAAGLAAHAWAHHRSSPGSPSVAPDVVFDSNPAIDALEREAYYGGYTGAFYLGRTAGIPAMRELVPEETEGPLPEQPSGMIYSVDVRSLYPSVMADGLFPRQRHEFRDDITPDELSRLICGRGATARVRIASWSNEYPTRTERGLIYQTGDYWTVLCGEELRRAIDSGDIREVEWAQFYSVGRIFMNFVQKFWELRKTAKQSGDTSIDILSKMILNSLSGKFAQRPGRWQHVPDHPAEHRWGEWWEIDTTTCRTGSLPRRENASIKSDATSEKAIPQLWRGIAGQAHLWSPADAGMLSFPAISAFITAAGREFMRKVRNQLPEKSVLYQATDMLLITEPGFRKLKKLGLLRESELGYFALQDASPDCEIKGSNWYSLGDEVVRSGLWGRARLDVAGGWYAEQWETCETHLLGDPAPEIRVTKVTLDSSDPTRKMVYNENGWGTWIQSIPTPEIFAEFETKSQKRYRKRIEAESEQ